MLIGIQSTIFLYIKLLTSIVPIIHKNFYLNTNYITNYVYMVYGRMTVYIIGIYIPLIVKNFPRIIYYITTVYNLTA